METLSVKTHDRVEMLDITNKVRDVVASSGVKEGVCVVYVPHTTAGVTINESADPDVAVDIKDALNRVIPFSAGYHHAEGNSAAHIKSSMVGASEHIIVTKGGLNLGTWQGIFFCEFDGPRSRKVHVKVING